MIFFLAHFQHQLILTLLTQRWLFVECECGGREELPEPAFAIAKAFSKTQRQSWVIRVAFEGTQSSSRSAEDSFYK